MSATGVSPVYFDFDACEEMQITTGGADVTMQSPGVSVNLVTKSGTDVFRGSGRWYLTDEAAQWVNVSDDLRKQGATTGNPIQNIKDHGVEAGGPIVRGKAWIWGSYGKQNINVRFSMFFNAAEKVRNARDASDLRPLETTYRQVGVTRSDLGSSWWSSANFKPVEWTPNPATCPAGSTCPTVTYYERLSQPGTA